MKLLRAFLAVVLGFAALRCGDSPGEVRLPADIDLSLDVATFAGTADGGNPAPIVVHITNTGEEPLTDLTVSVAYANGAPTGWLHATLSSTSAPSVLTLNATIGALRWGSYAGSVTIGSPEAAHGSVALNVEFTVAPAIPTAPSGLTATSASYVQVDLQWTDNSLIEDGFRIERCDGDGCTDFEYVAGVDPNVTNYAHYGYSTPSTSYRYRVQSVNAIGISAWSNVAEVTTPARPAIAVQPAEVSFVAAEGGALPAPQSVTVTNGGGESLDGLGVGLIHYADGEPEGWLAASIDRSNAPATLTIAVGFTSLPLGTYHATVPVTSGVATNSPQTVSVALQIARPDLVISAPAVLSVNPTEIQAPGEVVISDLTVSNTGAVGSPGGWVLFVLSTDETLTQQDRGLLLYQLGPIAPGASLVLSPGSLAIAADVPDGNYFIGVVLDPGDAIPETDETNNAKHTGLVVGAPPAIGLDPTSLTFHATVGGVDPFHQTVNVSNTGGRVLEWLELSSSYTGGTEGWLGYGSNRTTAPAVLSVGAQVADMPAGTHTATIAVQSAGASNSPQIVTITFVVAPLVGDPPAAPSDLVVTHAYSNGVTIRWTDNSTDEAGFRPEWCVGVGCSTFTELDRLGPDVQTYSLGVISPSTSYSFRVRAHGAGGNSGYSNIATVVTPPADAPPAAPSNLTASAVSATEIDLTWTDNSLNEYDFHIERAPGGTTDFVRIASVTTNVTAYRDAGRAPATSYTYRVEAWNDNPPPAYSNTATATTHATAAIDLDPETVSFSATAGAASPPAQSVAVANSGTGTLDRLALGAITYGDGEPTGWLAAALDGAVAPASVTLQASTGTLAAGSYSAKLAVLSPAATNSPQEIAVTFTVAPGLADLVVGGLGGAAFTVVPTAMQPGGLVTLPGVTVTNSGGVATGPFDVGVYLSADSLINGGGSDVRISGQTVAGLAPGAHRDFTNVPVQLPLVPLPSSVYVGVLVDGPNAVAELNEGDNYVSATLAVIPPPPPPAAPTNLAGSAISSSEIRLTWTDNSSTETGFRIERTRCITILDCTTVLIPVGPDATGFTNGGLTAASSYRYRVQAFNSGGSSAFTPTVTVSTQAAGTPPAPSALTAAAASVRQVDLMWTDNSTNETGFSIARCTGTGCTNFVDVGSVGADVATFADAGLGEATAYTWRVRAFNASGNSGPTNTAGATTLTATAPPAAPSGLTATAVSGNRVRLAWTDNAATERGFRIDMCLVGTNIGGGMCADESFFEIAVLEANQTTYENTGLIGSSIYDYRVRSYNSVGVSGYVQARAFTPPVPSAPTGLRATPVSSDRIDLAWNDVATETGYGLESCRGSTCTDFAPVASVAANVLTYRDDFLSPGTTYRYRVYAFNANGNSQYSTVITASSLPLEPPSGLTATPLASDRIGLTWTNNAPSWHRIIIQRCAGAGCSNFAAIDTLDTGTTFTNFGLAGSTSYSYRVYTTLGATNSDFSNTATALTAAVPAAPSGLSATVVSSSQVNLAWLDNSLNETQFAIERCTGEACSNFTSLASVNANITTYTNGSLAGATTYRYRVRARDGGNFSSYSGIVTASTPPAPGAPAAPSGLTVTAVATGRIDLSWTDNAGNETGYSVERCAGAGCTNFAAVLTASTPNVTTFQNTGLAAATTYRYRVRMFNAAGNSLFSNAAQATTPP